MNTRKPPQFLVFCGPSGCGKSTLAALLREALGCELCAVLSTDHYYQDLSDLTPEERSARNFDCLEAIDRDRLLNDLRQLVLGETIRIPQYDFVTHTRVGPGTEFQPVGLIVIEGIFAQSLLDGGGIPAFVIYLDLPVEVCLERRVLRDQAERGRTRAEIEARFRKDILPSITNIVLPQKSRADLVLDAGKDPRSLCKEVLQSDPLAEFSTRNGEELQPPIARCAP